MKLMQDPRMQRLVMRGFRMRGRVEGAIDRTVQRVAGRLNLATQRDVRALQKRIRYLEKALHEAEERLTESEDARAPRGHS
jgi:polyhydroxyalkanoate synthesis regulator phasin